MVRTGLRRSYPAAVEAPWASIRIRERRVNEVKMASPESTGGQLTLNQRFLRFAMANFNQEPAGKERAERVAVPAQAAAVAGGNTMLTARGP